MPRGPVVAVSGVGFIVLGIETARHDHWSTAVDRVGQDPRFVGGALLQGRRASTVGTSA